MPHPIRFVLVGTSHPGNIGAAARALKNMSLEELVLVRPASFPHPQASARASGAEDLLARARVESDLAAALQDCSLVLATTSRERDQYFRVLDVREAAARALEACEQAPVALLFGSERTGLSNAELEAAHALLRIPANPAYSSLNLAMAVQIVAYELLRARLLRAPAVPVAGGAPPACATPLARGTPLASPAQMRLFYAHLAEVLEQIDFRDRTQSGTHLMKRLRRLFQRAEPDQNEINILRGILTAVQQRRRRAG
ncbi:MAG TPA: RNA methyltransferase [Steroidobacteraceae bacterium]|nr:RNA methyltransferase [Steroidobacteraceae bacterium]